MAKGETIIVDDIKIIVIESVFHRYDKYFYCLYCKKDIGRNLTYDEGEKHFYYKDLYYYHNRCKKRK